MLTRQGYVRMKTIVISTIMVVIVAFVTFVAYNIVQSNCSEYNSNYTTATKVRLEYFLGMDCEIVRNYLRGINSELKDH